MGPVRQGPSTPLSRGRVGLSGLAPERVLALEPAPALIFVALPELTRPPSSRADCSEEPIQAWPGGAPQPLPPPGPAGPRFRDKGTRSLPEARHARRARNRSGHPRAESKPLGRPARARAHLVRDGRASEEAARRRPAPVQVPHRARQGHRRRRDGRQGGSRPGVGAACSNASGTVLVPAAESSFWDLRARPRPRRRRRPRPRRALTLTSTSNGIPSLVSNPE
jgi:hypothetical protein